MLLSRLPLNTRTQQIRSGSVMPMVAIILGSFHQLRRWEVERFLDVALGLLPGELFPVGLRLRFPDDCFRLTLGLRLPRRMLREPLPLTSRVSVGVRRKLSRMRAKYCYKMSPLKFVVSFQKMSTE